MKKSLHILILEDNPYDAELATKQLEREGFSITWTRVETEKAFREGLKGKPDLILPLVTVSGKIDEESSVRFLKGLKGASFRKAIVKSAVSLS